MKNFTATLTIVLSSFVFSTATLADDHAGPRTSALESYFCSYNDRKGPADLLKVAGEWDEWAQDNTSQNYAGYLLSPVVFNGSDFPFDSVWLGVTEDHESLGISVDEWLTKGTKLQKKFDSVWTCDSHGFMTSIEARPYPKLGQAGFLQISACQFNEGYSLSDITAADAKWTSWMDDNGMPGGIYRWIPNVGAPREDKTDFYHVYVTESLAERGSGTDMMIKGGFGVVQSIYADIGDCDNPRIWHAQPAGGKSGS